jgi:hypothetical protein|tara:strand:+ start:80 stop:316 length:237 start_codon:yes stop_codon:yes gene_type:complete
LAYAQISSQDRHDATTASIKKPIHNVKERAIMARSTGCGSKSAPEYVVFISGVNEGGGAYRDRTDDPLLAKQVLSQLS